MIVRVTLGCLAASILSILLAGCGGQSSLTIPGGGGNDEISKAISDASSSLWAQGGAGPSRTRSIDQTQAVTEYRGPRRNSIEWNTEVVYLDYHGNREFAIGSEGTIYAHRTVLGFVAIDPADGSVSNSSNNFPYFDDPSRWNSAPAILGNGELCHVQPRGSYQFGNYTCWVDLYDSDTLDPVLNGSYEITGWNATSSCVVEDGGDDIIYVMSDGQTPGGNTSTQLYKLRWDGVTLAPDWFNSVTISPADYLITPPTYRDGYIYTLTCTNYSPTTARLSRTHETTMVTSTAIIPLAMGEIITGDGPTVTAAGDVLFRTNLGIHSWSWPWGANWIWYPPTTDYSGPSSLAIMQNDLGQGQESVYFGLGYDDGVDRYGEVMGLDCATMASVWSHQIAEYIDTTGTGYGPAVDAENKLYVPAVGAFYCFIPHFQQASSTDHLWKRTDGLVPDQQAFQAHVHPDGLVLTGTDMGLDATMIAFGPGNRDVKYTPEWEQWGNGVSASYWNQRAADFSMTPFGGNFGPQQTVTFATGGNPLCSSPITAVDLNATGQPEAAWVTGETGSLYKFTNGITGFNPDGQHDPFNIGQSGNRYTSPTIQADGRIVYSQGGSYVGLDDFSGGALGTELWSEPTQGGSRISPCIVPGPDYGGMRVYVGESDVNSYSLKCLLDDGQVLWEHTVATPGMLEGTACYVAGYDELDNRQDTIFIQAIQDIWSQNRYWAIRGYDADTGVLVYENLNLGYRTGLLPYPTHERSVIYDGKSNLYMVTMGHALGFLLPPRGPGVTPLIQLWSTPTNLSYSRGGCLYSQGDSLFFYGGTMQFKRLKRIDVTTGAITWTSARSYFRFYTRPIVDQLGNIFIETNNSLDVYNIGWGTTPWASTGTLVDTVTGSPAFGQSGVYLPTSDVMNLGNAKLYYFGF